MLSKLYSFKEIMMMMTMTMTMTKMMAVKQNYPAVSFKRSQWQCDGGDDKVDSVDENHPHVV